MPLSSVLVVVVLVVLLDGHVGQVDEWVVHLTHLAVVFRCAESKFKNNAKEGISYVNFITCDTGHLQQVSKSAVTLNCTRTWRSRAHTGRL